MEGGGGGPVDLNAVPNKNFVLMVGAFAAMGGLMFGYDTGINGGIQVSKDFIDDFCTLKYPNDCTCHGNTDGDSQVYALKALNRTLRADPVQRGQCDTSTAPPEKFKAGTLLCQSADGKHVKAPCDCHADKASDVPTGWNYDKGNYISLLSFGAMIGALSAGQLGEILGRRKTISIMSAIFVFGTVVCCASAGSLNLLLFGRVLIGGPIGALSAVLPMYASEIAPKEIRGLLGTLFQLAIVVGILLATVIAIPVETMKSGWVFALGLAAVPAAVLAGGIWHFPESPRWLLKHQGEPAATASLQVLRASSDVSAELGEMKTALQEVPASQLAGSQPGSQAGARARAWHRPAGRPPNPCTLVLMPSFFGVQASAIEAAGGAGSGYSDLMAPPIRQRVVLAIGLQVLQQATGVNAIFYFAPTIFKDGPSNTMLQTPHKFLLHLRHRPSPPPFATSFRRRVRLSLFWLQSFVLTRSVAGRSRLLSGHVMSLAMSCHWPCHVTGHVTGMWRSGSSSRHR